MKRQRATQLLHELLDRATSDEWPARIVQSVHIFGSYARGALDPRDVDVAVDIDRDDRWRQHFINSLANGRDPYTVLRVALRGRRRGIQLLFERDSGGHDDIPMTLIWKRGESLNIAFDRLAAIPEDPNAGRAPREAMLPCFEGLEEHIPLFIRETLIALIDDGVIGVEQIALKDAEINDPDVRWHIDGRWQKESPLRRAAHATLSYLASRDVDIHAVHLHGEDINEKTTSHYVGFQFRYIRALPWCFTEYNGLEWIEVPKPTRSKPMNALHVQLLDRDKFADHIRYHSLF